VPFDQVLPLALDASSRRWLMLDTIAMHLGSQLLDTRPYREGLARLLDLVAALRNAGIASLHALDIGGGLGIRYRDEETLTPAALAQLVVPPVQASGLELVLEPGRFLVGAAGILLTEVLSRKHSGGKDLVIVDAGMNDFVRPSHYQAYHELVELEGSGGATRTVDVVGPVRNWRLPRARPGPAATRARGPPGRAWGRRVRLCHELELQLAAASRRSHRR